jgi:D-inositol-3-phosphate glycosyltransferase
VPIIPPALIYERFRPIDKKEAKRCVGIPCGDFNIMFAGRIEPLKGIDTLIRAMALLKERYPAVVENTCVAIIGGDPWADSPGRGDGPPASAAARPGHSRRGRLSGG